MFVSTERVAIQDEEGNVIYIRAKMDYGTKSKVVAEALQITPGKDTAIDLAAYNMALLVHNILAWEGPAFEGMPLCRSAIAQLDPDAPLVDMVLKAINERNLAPERDEKKSTRGGAARMQAGASRIGSDGMTSISSAPSAITGRRSK